jgi:hypothetical protein
MMLNRHFPAYFVLLLLSQAAVPVYLAAQQPQPTRAEYDMFQAAVNEKSAPDRVKQLDAFVAKYPQSTYLRFIYESYANTYNELRQPGKVIDFVDKRLAIPDELTPLTKVNLYYTRSIAFLNFYKDSLPNAKELANQARDDAREGTKLIAQLTKPENVAQDQWDKQRKQISLVFSYTDASASYYLKDYKAAIPGLKGATESSPNEPLYFTRLGVAYLREEPPQTMDGFWALAHAASVKGQGDAQRRDYLKNQINAYEQPACDSSLEAQTKEIIGLAASAADRPANYSIPSRAELNQVLQNSTIVTVLADLKAGGDKAKLTWLAVCSGEFPEVLAKVYEITPGTDAIDIKAFVGTTQEEMDASAAPNSNLKIPGQPDAARLEKEGVFRFGGALVDYTPDPFLITWDKVKVNPEDIPEEKKAPAKRPAKRPAKKPG